mmetsp:Transcript_23206/g.39862  ORF Transcript_23206/g.39862 Transcript_23206/m.39862 type:complete len:356 (+) Transcript_23206:587-1654(+)
MWRAWGCDGLQGEAAVLVHLDELNLEAVRVFHKRNHCGAHLHRPRLANDLAAASSYGVAGGVYVASSQGDVAVRVAHVVRRGAPVVRQLQRRVRFLRSVPDEGEGELAGRVLLGAEEFHAEDRGVEVEGAVQVTDAQHRVQHRLLSVGALDELDLVSVRVRHERDHCRPVLHRPRLPRHLAASVSDRVAPGVYVVARERDMTICGANVVRSRVPVVGQLQRRRRLLRAVRKEGEGELAVGKVFLAGEGHAEDLRVELDGALHVSHSQHRVQHPLRHLLRSTRIFRCRGGSRTLDGSFNSGHACMSPALLQQRRIWDEASIKKRKTGLARERSAKRAQSRAGRAGLDERESVNDAR